MPWLICIRIHNALFDGMESMACCTVLKSPRPFLLTVIVLKTCPSSCRSYLIASNLTKEKNRTTTNIPRDSILQYILKIIFAEFATHAQFYWHKEEQLIKKSDVKKCTPLK